MTRVLQITASIPIWIILFSCLTPGLIAQPGAAPADAAEAAFVEARPLMEKGRYVEASTLYRKAADRFRETNRPKSLGTSLLNLAVAYHASGNYKLAFETIDEADRLARETGDSELAARVHGLLGTVSTFSRKAEVAEGELAEAISRAESAGDAVSLAWLLNDYAVLQAADNDLAAAEEAFARCASLAAEHGIFELPARIAINRALTCLAAASPRVSRDFASTEETAPSGDAESGELLEKTWSELDAASALVRRLDDSYLKSIMLTTIGDAYRSLHDAGPGFRGNFTERAFNHFRSALEVAKRIENPVAMSYALGYAGNLYEERKRFDEALDLTVRARDHAREAHRPEALYRWEWQIARILAATGETAEALEKYRTAQKTLAGIRHDVAIGYGNHTMGKTFRAAVGNLYFEMADLLLRQAAAAKDDAEIQKSYREARLVVESFKGAELEDYFQDDCVNLARERREEIDTISPETAVLYMIPLPGRTEILVGIGDRIHRFTSDTGSEKLSGLAYEFRRWVEADADPTFFQFAQLLYDDLIRPAEDLFAAQGIRTLVFVPDGALRSIPMAALHDGEKFLVERFAIAVSPGLQLMEANRIPRGEARMLVGALSEGVQGFAPLQSVQEEAAFIEETFRPRPKVLLDAKFLKADFQRGVSSQPFQIVHIASHGEFKNNSRDSFILTYDDRINLDELESVIRPRQFVGKPVELLGLSACRTAAGDDRAALGLAGVAVKSGARSALASLWYADDVSSSEVVSGFYERLAADPDISKAEALRQAQLVLIEDFFYSHPRNWAPYLIIGNWL